MASYYLKLKPGKHRTKLRPVIDHLRQIFGDTALLSLDTDPRVGMTVVQPPKVWRLVISKPAEFEAFKAEVERFFILEEVTTPKGMEA